METWIKNIAPRAVCYNFPLVSDNPLGAPAFVRLIYLCFSQGLLSFIEDNLLNEFFIHGSPHLLSCTLRLFNCVFESGHFPEDWTIGLLVPLHKKGSMHSADNFRGITLLSIISKRFTRLLNNRLRKWAEEYGVYVEAQGGFREGRGTTDSIFVLTSLIQHFLNHGKSLYVAFIDFSKAFDYAVRENLWFKLVNAGTSGKILEIIKSMYYVVKTQIFFLGEKSEPFMSLLGVR